MELYSRKLQQLTLQWTEIQSILRLLHDYTSCQVVYYSLFEQNIFFPSTTLEFSKNFIMQYQKEIKKNNTATTESSFLLLDDNTIILSQPIICLGQTLSYVGIIIDKPEEKDVLSLLLDYTGKAIAIILIRKLYLEEKTLENQNELINEILENKISNEEQALTRIGHIPLKQGHYLYLSAILEIEHDLMNQETKTFLFC
ncbi:hypothetical protein [Niallia sp. 03133]|uniref:hypothetical protein n=1 Tax=Niallia sp. 03133 TaxID=3458060 RepID=UPI0040444FAE